MHKTINEEQLVQAIICSNENYCFQLQNSMTKKSRYYSLKYFCWLAILVFFSPRFKTLSKRFITMINPISIKRIQRFYPNEEYYYFARLNSSFRKVRANRSVLSSYSRIKRLSIFFSAVMFCLRHNDELKGFFHFSIEYYFIAKYLNDHDIEEIVFQGIYDRYNTLFSYFGECMKIPVIGIQDGACVFCDIPQKIYCSKMYCFDEFEEQQFKKYIKNQDCDFEYVGYESIIKWEEYNTDKKIIGIASQDWFTEKTINLIDAIARHPQSSAYTIIVFPHYREDYSMYKNVITQYPQIVLEPKKRYSNVDILITFYSTIVYDFMTINNSIKTICLYIPGFMPAYYQKDSVVVCESINEVLNNTFNQAF